MRWYIIYSLWIAAVSHACDFPDFMQTNNTNKDWRTRIKSQYTEFGVQITVDGNVMRTVSTDSSVRSYTRVCLQSFGDHRYLVAHESTGQGGSLYTCVQFLKHSKYVVQLKGAEIINKMDRSLCDNLELNPWLIIDKAHIGNEQFPCALEGGFSTRIYDGDSYAGMCDGYQGETRLESECVRGEGLTFYFRHQTCVPVNLYMFATQHTVCLANWQHGPNGFMLLKHSQMQYMWVMRFPATVHDNFVAFVFYDMVAEEEASQIMTSEGYMRLDSVRDIPINRNSLCVDDYEMCSYYNKPCDSDTLALTCPRTCRVCNSTRPSSCKLNSRYMGQWYDAANPGTLALTVNTTFLTTFDDQGYQERFHCMEWDKSPEADEDTSTYMLVSDYNNGCKPRYSCVSFLQKASSVLFIKLTQGKAWPFTTQLTQPADCSNFIHEPDKTLIPNMFKSDNYKLIYSRTSNSVPCELPSGLTNYAVSFKDGTSCTSSIVSNPVSNGFTVMLSNCEAGVIDSTHTCVESSRLLPSTLLIVTRSAQNSEHIYCWVFPRGNHNNAFYLLEPAHCNESVRRRIRKGRLKSIASFTKTRRPKNGKPRPATDIVNPPSSPVMSGSTPTDKLNMEDLVGDTTPVDTPTPRNTNELNDTVLQTTEDDDHSVIVTATPFVIIAALLFVLVFQIPCTCRN